MSASAANTGRIALAGLATPARAILWSACRRCAPVKLRRDPGVLVGGYVSRAIIRLA